MLAQRLSQPLSYLKECQMQFCRVQQEFYRSALQPHAHREISDTLHPIFAQQLPPQQKKKDLLKFTGLYSCSVIADSFLCQKNHDPLRHFGFPLAATQPYHFGFRSDHMQPRKQNLSGPLELLVSKQISGGTVGMPVWSFPCPCRKLAFAALKHMIST